MKFERKIKEKLNQEMPYSPAYEDFASSANIEAKPRRRAPIYHSIRRRILQGALVSIAAIGVIGAIVPAIINANGSSTTIPYLVHKPKKLERTRTLSEKTAGIYGNFVKTATTSFFKLNQTESESQCISLPDLFFSCSMLASISSESVQNEFLSMIEAESINQLKAASQELASYLVFLEKADEAGESDYGTFGLNGFFYDSDSKLKDGYEGHLQTFSESFNAYSFSSRPTKNIIEKWQEEEDENGYLAEGLNKDYSSTSDISIISSAALFDSFSFQEKETFRENYENGFDTELYSFSDDDEREIDFLHLYETDETVYMKTGEFQLMSASINKTEVTVILPEYGVDVDDLAASNSIFDYDESTMLPLTFDGVAIPMFCVDKSVNVTAEQLFDCFKEEGFASNFIEDTDVSCSISQNNKLTLDYNGFEGSANKPDVINIGGMKPANNTVVASRPFIFSVSYEGVNLCYGKIHDPNYSPSPLAIF